MIFYKRITICNLYAYYGVQNIEFEADNDKTLYLIYGRNGYGKTSFIGSLRLLFLGSGLLNSSRVPQSILNNIERGRGQFTSSTLLLGARGDETKWEGALNKRALKEQNNEYYIEVVLLKDQKEIVVRRSWKIYWSSKTEPSLSENLIIKFDNMTFSDNEAQEKLNQIFPTEFIDFFIFDGEQIKNLAMDLERELKDKIQDILNISILEKLISQIENKNKELLKTTQKNTEELCELTEKRGELESIKVKLPYLKDRIESLKNDRKNKENQISNHQTQRDKDIKNSGQEQAKYQNEINLAEQKIEKSKDNIKDYGAEILFFKLDDFFRKFSQDINNSQNIINFDSEMLERLSDFSAKYLYDRYQLGDKLGVADSWLVFRLKESFEKFEQNQNINPVYKNIRGLSSIESIYNGLSTNLNLLNNAILDIKSSQSELQTSKKLLDKILMDNTRDKLDSIKQEIEKLEIEKQEINDEIKNFEQSLDENLKKQIELENRINWLEDKIGQNERISRQYNIIKSLKSIIIDYKDKRIQRVAKKLKDKIYNNYKKLLPNDNVTKIEIENFTVNLINSNGDYIAIANQSAGQKQIMAISIFWALSELSDRILPLVIDTPLSRIDRINRENIIKNYYFNASNQVIILPHDGEFGFNEYEISKDKIKEIYKIDNQSTKDMATISKSNIKEILGEANG